MRIKIGVIGENSNDVKAVVGLLKKQSFAQNTDFFELFEHLGGEFNGGRLDEGKGNKAARVAGGIFREEKPNFVLYIRDLDRNAKNRAKYKEQIKYRTSIFEKLQKEVNYQAIFMLNIYEIEALILADFETFKRFYNNNTWIFDEKTAATIANPKGVLKDFSGEDANIGKLVPKLNIDIVSENHTHFNAFHSEFQKMVEGQEFDAIPL